MDKDIFVEGQRLLSFLDMSRVMPLLDRREEWKPGAPSHFIYWLYVAIDDNK